MNNGVVSNNKFLDNVLLVLSILQYKSHLVPFENRNIRLENKPVSFPDASLLDNVFTGVAVYIFTGVVKNEGFF